METSEKVLSTLINAMDFVEPRQSIPVPDHLLETKAYSKVGKNSFIQAQPAAIHFHGFSINEKHTRMLTIINTSSSIVRIHIIPPQTKYVSIRYEKEVDMVPGLSLKCKVDFMPDEWRYYYDSIRIHCQGEENLVIPIHGYPVMSTKGFPKEFTFPDTPMGHSTSHKFPLKSMAPVDFEYEVACLHPHPAFRVHPASGVVPANGETEVTVTFAPYDFQTACLTMQLNISQFNAAPIICSFIGTSKPGLLREKTLNEYAAENAAVLDPRCVSPLDRGRFRRKIKPCEKNQQSFTKKMECKGLHFPAVIKSPFAVAQVLNQEPGKLKAKDLRETILFGDDDSEVSRQVKEARFRNAVSQNALEERQNQLRWQVKRGNEQISNKERCNILDTRAKTYLYYRVKKQEDPDPQHEYSRQLTQITHRRTVRDDSKIILHEVLFDTCSNNTWATRHATIMKFIQAVQKVIVRNRASRRLRSLQVLVINQHENKRTSDKHNSSDGYENSLSLKLKEKEGEAQQNPAPAVFIFQTSFSTYIPPEVKDEMAADYLGQVPLLAMHLTVKQKTPFFSLQVPQIYHLQGYHAENAYEASSGYIPQDFIQHLHAGAEDEVLLLLHPADIASGHNSLETNVKDRSDFGLLPVEKEKEEIFSSSVHDQFMLMTRPPDELFMPINYPSVHIMNPMPGLQAFQAPVPYSEVDSEFHLCPLPKYITREKQVNTQGATQQRHLDHEATVRSIMSWKKFPSQGIASSANTSTLTSVWVPRWDNSFSIDVLPISAHRLLDGLASEELCVLVEEHEHKDQFHDIYLTPTMVIAQFGLVHQIPPQDDVRLSHDIFPFGKRMPPFNLPVGTQGQLSREKREEELEYHVTKKYNRLGTKVSEKKARLNSLLTEVKLILQ